MTFNFDSHTYRLKFRHDPYVPREGGKKRWQRRQTDCLVQELLAGPRRWQSVAIGSAWCSITDIFCKETGRRIALTRALEQATKPFRAAAYATYYGRRRANRRYTYKDGTGNDWTLGAI